MEETYELVRQVICDGDTEESQKRYKNWSENYDDSLFEKLGFLLPHYAAEALAASFGERKDVSILDIGAGTGRVGHHLRTDFNFNGEIDLLDANMEMLLCASQKEHLKFRTIIKHFILEDGTLPVKDNTYDGLVCIGSFLPNHIPPKTVRGFVKALKTGGIFVFNLRSKNAGEYNIDFESVLQALKTEGNIEISERKEVTQYKNYSVGNCTSILITIKKLK